VIVSPHFVLIVAAALRAGTPALPARVDTVTVDSVATETASVDGGPRRGAAGFTRAVGSAATEDTTQSRHRAVEYSDWYARRLTIHRWGSYAMLPLFVGEYVLGEKLIDGTATSSTRGLHQGVAGAVGGLFAINTVTGVWNLWESRPDDAGRTRRFLHSGLMIAADAGFVATGVVASKARNSTADANLHRNVALSSMAVATAGTLMMWLWKD